MKKTLPSRKISDANEAVASVAYRVSELITIYPITPSSPMAEFCDEWSAREEKNLWGSVPEVFEMQSEAGVAGALHGALQAGSIATTFTASQGLLLMIPNMYKIAGELIPFCMHVSARAVATHALSIFGDHSDVMACRSTGFALLASSSAQEAQDFAAIATSATFLSRVPFLHFFDGFRTSHEINCYDFLTNEELHSFLPQEAIDDFRQRALTPDHPTIRGTAQNADVYFQGRERSNVYYQRASQRVAECMEKFAQLTNRHYQPFDYEGSPNPETIFVLMGSACETVSETIRELNEQGEKLGLVRVRLYRPFDGERFVDSLKLSAKNLIVLDRTKEPGALGEPLYLDVVTALQEARQGGQIPATFQPHIYAGRYGLGSKEFSPAMVSGIIDRLRAEALSSHFTVGIEDDITHLSVPYEPDMQLRAESKRFNALFFGLGSDGTVGANKNTIKILGEETESFVQAYFVYDSKKSGAMTVSHLRLARDPIHAPYLIEKAQFIGCHQFAFLEKLDILRWAADGSTFLLNAPYSPEEIQDHLPEHVQRQILDKHLKFYLVDAYKVASECAMGRHINSIMQSCFFAITEVLPRERAIQSIKKHIAKTYEKKGHEVIDRNFACVDAALNSFRLIKLDPEIRPYQPQRINRWERAPEFLRQVIQPLLEDRGNELPVSVLPEDGTWPTGTASWEKRSIAQQFPQWNPELCIQCNKCAFVCPHAAIRTKYYKEDQIQNAPAGFQSMDFRSRQVENQRFTVQVSPADCTSCGLCVANCPGKSRINPQEKALQMVDLEEERRLQEMTNFDFFLNLPDPDLCQLSDDVKGSQFRRPLFEFSGACAGCGETPYIKLLTQLFGNRLMIANATGCSSIYGANLPTTPYCKDAEGRGPAWANSLFEDNAEFGLGMLLSVENKRRQAKELLIDLRESLGLDFVHEILVADQATAIGIEMQRERIRRLKENLVAVKDAKALRLKELADYLVKKSVWLIGGDGWAYDIGFGGLDHALASGKRIKILVLDTEVYSNTGGQQSKSTPRAAIAKFAAAGKALNKKDLGAIARSYGYIYVAQVALGAKDSQTVNAFLEAESYDGPALIIAYAPCIAHGYNLSDQLAHQKMAVDAGYWPLYRYDPRKLSAGKAFILDSKMPENFDQLDSFMASENRFNLLRRTEPERAKILAAQAQQAMAERFRDMGGMFGEAKTN